MEKRYIYADNAATTAVSKEVLDTMLPYFCVEYGNASSAHRFGRNVQRDIETAREKVAKAIGAETYEIYFTSGGSEADNWAIKGTAELLGRLGKRHIITSAFEHHAVLNTTKYLEKNGFEVTYIPVSRNGIIAPSDIASAIRDDTALVTVMYVNNEIGTIQPINEIAEICRERNVLFHTDAVQAVGHVEINVHEQGIDMLSLSGHKIHAPKGIGALYVRKGIDLPVLIHGGGQERGKRAGTENAPAIIGLGFAIEAAVQNINEKASVIIQRRNRLIDGLLKIPCTHLNGDIDKRLAGNVNITIDGTDGEAMLLMLDMNGICASAGAACTSGDNDSSHVLLSIGLDAEAANSSLRFSIEADITEEEIDYIVDSVRVSTEKLRAKSFSWKNNISKKK